MREVSLHLGIGIIGDNGEICFPAVTAGRRPKRCPSVIGRQSHRIEQRRRVARIWRVVVATLMCHFKSFSIIRAPQKQPLQRWENEFSVKPRMYGM